MKKEIKPRPELTAESIKASQEITGLKDVIAKLKKENRNLKADVKSYKKELGEANQRLEIAEKVIADKNKSKTGLTLDDFQKWAMESEPEENLNMAYGIFKLCSSIGSLNSIFAAGVGSGRLRFHNNNVQVRSNENDNTVKAMLAGALMTVIADASVIISGLGIPLSEPAEALMSEEQESESDETKVC